MAEDQGTKPKQDDPLYAFPIVALIAFVLWIVIAFVGGGFFADPIGPSRIIVGSVCSLIGLALIIGGLRRPRDAGEFGGGCFMLGLGTLILLGVPPCLDCGGY